MKTFATVCSGIGAPEVALARIGWRGAFAAEIEAFPAAVLAERQPGIPNYGDMTQYHEWPAANPDVLVAGTPCQSFSVAGLRKGLADPRGNLTLAFLGVIERFASRWVLWENVPGVLSDASGAFGSFLGGLGQLGYGFAYRILDAQFFGVAQRRRRVVVVGHAGGLWQRAAAVLFERDCLCGHPAPRRQTWEGTAGTISARLKGGGGLGTDFDCAGGCVATLTKNYATHHGRTAGNNGGVAENQLIAATLSQSPPSQRNGGSCPTEGHMIIAPALTRNDGKQPDNSDTSAGPMLIPVTAGFDASEDGTGRGTPIVPEVAYALQERDAKGIGLNPLQPEGVRQVYGNASEINPVETLRILRKEIGAKAFAQWGLGILNSLQPSEILRQTVHGQGIRLPTFSKCWLVHCALSRAEDYCEGVMQSVREARCGGCPPQGREPSEQCARELGAYLSQLSQPGPQAKRFMQDLWEADEGPWLLRKTLSALQEIWRSNAIQAEPAQPAYAVRRLTPEECEFLQGFPRGYTRITYRGKPACDGPRYRALGNSMAVPVIEWLGRRMDLVDELVPLR